MAAAAICLARGIEPDAVRSALRTFAGVEHRLEEVATIDGVLYVNDSKATNVASTLVALESFDTPIHLILGGQGKGEDYAPLREPVAERCAGVYLIGEEAERLGAVVGGRALRDARARRSTRRPAAARPGEVVLLSPACASFDQFDGLRGPRAGASRSWWRRDEPSFDMRAAARAKPKPAPRVQPAAHGDAVPARPGRGDGLQRLERAHAAAGRRRRHDLPRALPGLRRRRASWPCT